MPGYCSQWLESPPDLAAVSARQPEQFPYLLESATGPRTTRQSPIRWSDDPDWKLDYSNVERIAPEGYHIVLDANGKVVHAETVGEVTDEPNYDAALAALKNA